MRAAHAVPEDVLEILSGSEVEGDLLYLPPDLDRALYLKVAKTLSLVDCKWDRRAGGPGRKGAHVFASGDAGETINSILLTRQVIDLKKAYQFFETQPPAAHRLCELADPAPGSLIIEPSAGRGAIARVIRELHPDCTLHVGDANPEFRDDLWRQGFHVLDYEDFLAYRPARPYDFVIQNPPFNRCQEALHVLHGYGILGAGGYSVNVMSRAVDFRREEPYARVRDLIRRRKRRQESLPPGSFKASGTDVDTQIIMLEKPGRDAY